MIILLFNWAILRLFLLMMTMIYMDLPEIIMMNILLYFSITVMKSGEGKVPTDFVGTLTDLLNDGQTFLLEEDGFFLYRA